MADDRDLEPTEPASQRRLEQARAQGQVARSPELSNVTVLLAGVGAVIFLTPSLSEVLLSLFSQAITLDRATMFSPLAMMERLNLLFVAVLFALLPLLLILLVVPVVSALLVGGWLFAPQTMAVNAARTKAPASLARLFSLPSVFGLLNILLKTTLLAAGLFTILWLNADALVALTGNSVPAGAAAVARWLGGSLLSLAAMLLAIALGDAAFRTWYFRRSLRMTRAEVLQEYCETEGDPALKSRVRARQQQLLSARGTKHNDELT